MATRPIIPPAMVLLLFILFTGIGICILFAATGGYKDTDKEGLVGWFNVNSDDMLNYTDGADANIANQIKWKIRGCSTITQTDLDIAVANAKRAQQIEDSVTAVCKK